MKDEEFLMNCQVVRILALYPELKFEGFRNDFPQFVQVVQCGFITDNVTVGFEQCDRL